MDVLVTWLFQGLCEFVLLGAHPHDYQARNHAQKIVWPMNSDLIEGPTGDIHTLLKR
jgi:hypothetical protein